MTNTSKPRRVGVVMAGGSGERFWPLSRQQHPKQLLHLTSDRQTMLEEAVARLVPLIPSQDIYVATAAHLVDAIRAARVGVADENVIAEPCKRNSSGCLAYAAAHLLVKYGPQGLGPADLSMAVVTADPLIGDAEAFRQTIKTALDAAEEEHALATIGIVPTRPETGYGYVQIPKERQPLPRHAEGVMVYPVTRFHEKPNREMAEEFLATGRYFWNAGMFFWNIATFLTELDIARPEMMSAVYAMFDAMRAGDAQRVAAIFQTLEDISIDYALMEHARNVVMARATFAWDDVGAWSALDRTRPHDDAGNVVVGNPVLVDCEDCIVYNAAAEPGREMAVAVIGAKDLVVVTTDDAILVIPKDRAQDVKYAVAELKRRNARQV